MLRRSIDSYDARAERLTLLTLHAAKGLEFPIVFIAAGEDGILPYTRPGEPPDVEEERRLLYVGMTRAQRVLYLTSARRRTLFGRTTPRRPSPFVAEIEAALRDVTEARTGKRRPLSTQLEFNLGD
jgi:superfamily I DNA/RNA helicase